MKEYWIMRPYEENIHQFYLEGDRYALKGIYGEGQSIRPIIFPDLEIAMKDILL